MRELIERLVACGTRHSLSRGITYARAGCGRDNRCAPHEIPMRQEGSWKRSRQVRSTGPRTNNKPAHMENVYAILPGSDPTLSKTVFIISGILTAAPAT